MIVRKFSYTNKFDVLAPLKCGTRWLEKNTNPNNIEEIIYGELFNENQIHNEKTFFIYRDVLEHFKSGLHTEYLWWNYTPIEGTDVANKKLSVEEARLIKPRCSHYKDINVLFKKLTVHVGHFIPNLWEKIYQKKPNFIFIKLDNLKSIFNDENMSYDPTDFDFSKEYNDVPTKEEVFNMLSENDLDKLNKIIEKENYYLNEILSIK
jgi:hypothetical protein